MPHLSPKLWTTQTNLGPGVAFWCPGCGETHTVTIEGRNVWTFDGNAVSPTFRPSVLVCGVQPLLDDEHMRVMAGEAFEPKPRRCHSYVTAGRIEFLPDCTHALAGKTVDMPDLPAEYWEDDA